jgi:hypothetical protein
MGTWVVWEIIYLGFPMCQFSQKSSGASGFGVYHDFDVFPVLFPTHASDAATKRRFYEGQHAPATQGYF